MPKFCCMSSARIKRIESASASKAIYRTIEMVESELGIEFPRGETPSESRAMMVETLASYFR